MFDGNFAHCVTAFLAPSGRAAEKSGAQEGAADAGPDFPGPLFSLLAAVERVWLQERQLSPGLHARHQVPAGPPFPPRQRLPGEGSPTLGAGGLWGASPPEEASPHLPPRPRLVSVWLTTESLGLR